MSSKPTVRDLPNLRHIQIFNLALQSGSISLAADRMNLTQPAASQGISNLEKDMGAALLVRGGKSVTATEHGEIFAPRAARAITYLRGGIRTALGHAGQDQRLTDQLLRNITATQIRALIAIGRHGGFTVAAKSLALAQPTVHRTAKSLEAVCSFEVFRATYGRIELTASGHALNQSAKLARAELRQAREELALSTGKGRRTFVLGSLPLAQSQIIPEAITNMLQREKQLQVRVIEGRYAELLRGLREGDIDCLIGALRNPAPASDVSETALFDDDLVIVCAASHPLAQQASVALEQTLAYPWIAPPISTPSGQYLFETLDIERRASTPVRVVASSFVLLRELLLVGGFLTVISKAQVKKEIAEGFLHELPVPLEGQTRSIGFTMRNKWHPTTSQQAFLKALKDVAQKENGQQ
ncbi:LysR family transcriptional regulator [Pseudopelagicola sp. nBUS_19]|uniref:LysR family transcriptional regulator n=1 Tax=Pseudopelagicola sp. nBUS_19 TaxID=3395316 RepID=UPI003EBA3686